MAELEVKSVTVDPVIKPPTFAEDLLAVIKKHHKAEEIDMKPEWLCKEFLDTFAVIKQSLNDSDNDTFLIGIGDEEDDE